MASASISVAMATYNGARFISEQLESLASQTFLPYELVVCDDGSTDSTLDIVAAFAQRAPFPVRIVRNEKNLGYADNFLKAASLCKGEWVSFCDQDDVWLPDKISDVVNAVQADNRPGLILQNSYLCKEDLTHTHRIFPAKISAGFHKPRSQYAFWVWPGFVKTVRAELIKTIPHNKRPKSFSTKETAQTHDKWTCMIGNATGGILVLPKPAALYRRHASALTGNYEPDSLSERVGNSLPIGSEHYNFLAEVASDSAKYLRNIAAIDNSHRSDDFCLSAGCFDRLAQIQLARSGVYKANGLIERLKNLACVARLGGYFGPRMIALGWKSATKDIFMAFGVFSIGSNKNLGRNKP